MNFILQMTLRELRSSWRRLAFFFACIAVGVGSITLLRSMIGNIQTGVVREARTLMTGDLEVSSRRPLSPETTAVIERFAAVRSSPRQTVVETPTMARPVSGQTLEAQRIELRAVQAEFPFYGQIILADGKTYSHELLKNRGILVQPALLARLGLKIGEAVKIGNAAFEIRGVLDREPGTGLTAFSFGPRVLMDLNDLEATGLLTVGTQARYRILFKLPEDQLAEAAQTLKTDLKGGLVTVRSYRETQDQLGNQLFQAENFFSLIGLVVILLGGIGISSVTQVYIAQRIKTVAVLKCVGATNRRILATYLTQTALLALVGSAFGILLAALTIRFLPGWLGIKFSITVNFGLTWSAVLQGLGVGFLVSLLFSILPLLQIRTIKPNVLLRNERSASGRRLDWIRFGVGSAVVAGLLVVAAWQAGSVRVGGWFLVGLAAAAGILFGVGTVLMRMVRGLRVVPSFALRQGLGSLHRPGNQTQVVLLTIGLGVFFMTAIQAIQINLQRELDVSQLARTSDMFLIDVQNDQREGVLNILKAACPEPPELIPTLRARLIAFNDKPIDLAKIENETDRGRLGREYTITYRSHLEPNERITGGAFWDSTPSREPEVSVDYILYKNHDLKVGDTITVDVLGRQLKARISSLRRIDWRNSRTGFVLVFRPGVFDDAPQTYIAGIKGPKSADARNRLQGELVAKYPNVTIIDVLDIVSRLKTIFDNISLAVSVVGGFVILSGGFILVGSIALTKYHRMYETAILKTLGAKRELIVQTMLVEYGILGLLAGIIGSGASVGLAWALSEYVFKIERHFSPGLHLVGVALTMIAVVAVGVLSCLDVLVKKPLGVLRAD